MTARRFFTTLSVLLLLVVGIDFAIGVGADWLLNHAKGGDTGRHHYINRRSREDVLVFGSSRAIHHYDPRILEEGLGLSAYNCGTDGCGTLLNYMQLNNILERYTPKLVIWDMYGPYDFLKESDLTKYLGWERMYYGRGNAAVDSVFIDADPAERLKMLSNAYRYNYRFIQMLSDNVSPHTDDVRGYRPIAGELTGEWNPPAPWSTTELDPVKLEYLRRFAERCREKGVRMVVAISPYYFESEDCQLPAEVREILNAYDVRVFDFSRHPDFVGNNKYFYDTNHLSEEGATAYTHRILQELQALQNAENQSDKK